MRLRDMSSAAMAALAAFLTLAPARAQEAPEILNYSGADRQEKLLEGAKKEGQVVVYSAVMVNQAMRPIAEGFMRKYPFVKLTYWRADTDEIVAKVGAEERASNLVADVIEGTGAGELTIEAGIAQPYQTPLLADFDKRYIDPRHLWTSTRLSYFGMAYNTKLVSDAEVPRTYEALLDPKWKGKMAWRIGTATGTPMFITNLRMAMGEDAGLDYLKKLATQKVINFAAGSARTLVDRVIAGEFPIALHIFAHHPLISRAKGAPTNTVLLDPTPSNAGTMLIPKGVRHPYAAMLFADFLLGKEGQEILAKAEYFPVRSDTPPLPALAPVVPAHAGVSENFIGSEKLNDMYASSEAIWRDLFK
jgi:ABC-type Fe3+ transport system substrate-binding protein